MMQMDILHPAYFDRELELKCLKVKQPIGEFYIASIGAKELREITYSDVRRMEGERGFESYLGVQRPLSKPRVEEISVYTRTVDACFPTSVLLSVQARCAEYDEARGVLTLKAYKGEKDSEFPDVPFFQLANVIDGQHRIAGLDGFSGDSFEVNVSIFVDIDVATEAYLFSTVNLAQTKVNKSLVYDLYELATKKSPQKLCHEMAVLLDKEPDSPFYSRIKRLGSAQPHNVVGSITQAAFVQAFMRLISESPMKDRDTYMRGKIPHMADSDPSRTIFREFMIKDRDFDIVDIVWDYFDAVKDRWPSAWNSRDKGVILSKTNGFMALVRFLRDCYLSVKKEKPSKADFKAIFDRMNFEDDFFTTERFKPGSSGESGLYKALIESGALNRAR